MGRPKKIVRKEVPTLDNAKESKPSTEVRIYELAEKIVRSGSTRLDIMNYCKDEWGLSTKQSERYYYSALNFLRPENPEEYREALINKNYNIAEGILNRALSAGNLKEANNALRILNQMLGVGGKQIEIQDKDSNGGDRTFIISFGD